ncbi:MAG: carboxypeptidase-like regulatory domain-containing protein [Gemmatimonadota bacterium]|nr:carboxypeptidase-like regulatory domain-containing protein [Gemmatimonadota bacterium]
MKKLTALFLLVLIAAFAGNVGAQRSTLLGTVLLDSAERPAAGAEIVISSLGRRVHSDLNGVFRLDSLAAGTYPIIVRVAGYVQLESTLSFGISDTLERDFVLLRRSAMIVLAAQESEGHTAVRASAIRQRIGDANLIRVEEFQQAAASATAIDLYDLLRTLRPNMMRARGKTMGDGKSDDAKMSLPPPTTPDRTLSTDEPMFEPLVYVNNARVGHLAALHAIPASNVSEVRYLSPIDATQRFGIGHSSGAILVTLGAR